MRTLRQPALIVPTIVFPLFLLAVNSSGLSAATNIPGFPADSYLDFAITVCFIQGAMFAAITAGTELATDVESGFLNRLQLTPLRRLAILVGQMAGAMALALLGAVTYLLVGLDRRRRLQERRRRARSCSSCSPLLIALGFSARSARRSALRTGIGEAVQGAFPLLFVAALPLRR